MPIPFGGLADIDIKPGETVIIAPATGRYESAAAHVALAMGTRVVAIGRNASILSQMKKISPRLDTVQITNEIEKDILIGGLWIKGTWMCTQVQTKRLIRMVESGVLPLGQHAGMGPVKAFGLGQWVEALATASEEISRGEIVITP